MGVFQQILMAGGKGATGLLTDTYDSSVIGGPNTADFTVSSTGQATGQVNNLNGHGTYATGYAGAAYDIFCSVTAGAMSTGTTATWLSLGTTRSWSVTRPGVGAGSCTATFSIRNASTLTVLTSAVIDLQVSGA